MTGAQVILESKITLRYSTVVDQWMLCPAICFDVLFLLLENDIACIFVEFIFNF